MATWASSDWHCEPEALREGVEEWVREGKAGNHHLIAAGDLFDILPLGKKKWKEAASIRQLAILLDGYRFDYVAGNHDPHKTMKKLMAPYPNITMHKQLELEIGERKYFVTHGHRWALDWGYLGLRRIAPWFVERVVDLAPGLWYRFCRWRGWLASHKNPKATPSRERQRINKLTGIIWAGASDHALKKDCSVILGHTHTTGRRERGISREITSQAYMYAEIRIHGKPPSAGTNRKATVGIEESNTANLRRQETRAGRWPRNSNDHLFQGLSTAMRRVS